MARQNHRGEKALEKAHASGFRVTPPVNLDVFFMILSCHDSVMPFG